jgi:hypothetical protein
LSWWAIASIGAHIDDNGNLSEFACYPADRRWHAKFVAQPGCNTGFKHRQTEQSSRQPSGDLDDEACVLIASSKMGCIELHEDLLFEDIHTLPDWLIGFNQTVFTLPWGSVRLEFRAQ